MKAGKFADLHANVRKHLSSSKSSEGLKAKPYHSFESQAHFVLLLNPAIQQVNYSLYLTSYDHTASLL